MLLNDTLQKKDRDFFIFNFNWFYSIGSICLDNGLSREEFPSLLIGH